MACSIPCRRRDRSYSGSTRISRSRHFAVFAWHRPCHVDDERMAESNPLGGGSWAGEMPTRPCLLIRGRIQLRTPEKGTRL